MALEKFVVDDGHEDEEDGQIDEERRQEH